jgi:hypothetical protein
MPFDKASDEFLEQTGPLAMDAATACAGLDEPPAGFERIWAAFDPLEVMQKRGQIFRPAADEAWQLLCDEGPVPTGRHRRWPGSLPVWRVPSPGPWRKKRPRRACRRRRFRST